MRKLVIFAAVILAAAAAVILTLPHSRQSNHPTGGIISLVPSATEILFALGAGDRVIGVSTACDYPPESKGVLRVGDFAAPKIELLYELKPSLVITTDLRDNEIAQAIRGCGAKLLIVQQGTYSEVVDSIEQIGAAIGAEAQAEKITRRMRERLARSANVIPDDRRPTVFVELSERPLRTGGKGSFLDDIITLAGGRNIAHDIDRQWLTISPDTVVLKNPDIIIITYPVERDATQIVSSRIGWQNINAVKTGDVHAELVPDLILRPGPRLADGIDTLARIFAEYAERNHR